MPKLVGNSPRGGTELPDNFTEVSYATGKHSGLVRLSYSQMVLMPPSQVYFSYDTTDRGSRGSLAKRWYRWFAKADDIKRNPCSTANMAAKADAVLGFPPSDHR